MAGADFPSDGTQTFWWVDEDGIADVNAPEDDEINAGVALLNMVPPDGFDPGFSDNQFDTSKIDTTIDTEEQGRRGAKPKLTCYIKDVAADNLAWNTLVYNTRGFLVRRESTAVAPGTPAVAAQKVDIFPITTGERKFKPTAANAARMFESQGALYAPYALGVAVVAAP